MPWRKLLCLAALAGRVAAQDPVDQDWDEVVPPRTDLVPEPTRPILDLGDPFLESGTLNEPFVTFWGATWHPSFQVFGTLRSALGSFDDGQDVTTEWATRLDLFGNLQLSGTERFLIGFRPLDEDGRFTRYVFAPSDGPLGDGFEDELNSDVTTFFFEGDFGELFPRLDPDDSGRLDWGFSIGRQQLTLQDGLLVNDRIDLFGLTRNTLLGGGASNIRVSGLFGWSEIDGGDNVELENAILVGLDAEADLPRSTVSFDVLFVEGEDALGEDTEALYAGFGAVQRIGHWNSTLRLVTSQPTGDETSAAGQGGLVFAELSRNPVHSDDLVYANAFYAVDQYTSAARGPETGGPLGRLGILFAAVGVGSFGAPLGNDAQDSLGAAVGWQTFFGEEDRRRQLVLEAGGRADTDSSDQEAVALGASFQQAFGRRTILRLDGFVAGRDGLASSSGVRAEIQIKL